MMELDFPVSCVKALWHVLVTRCNAMPRGISYERRRCPIRHNLCKEIAYVVAYLMYQLYSCISINRTVEVVNLLLSPFIVWIAIRRLP